MEIRLIRAHAWREPAGLNVGCSEVNGAPHRWEQHSATNYQKPQKWSLLLTP